MLELSAEMYHNQRQAVQEPLEQVVLVVMSIRVPHVRVLVDVQGNLAGLQFLHVSVCAQDG